MKLTLKSRMLALALSFITAGVLVLPLQANAIEVGHINEQRTPMASTVPIGGYAPSENWQTVYTKNDDRTGTITFEVTKVSPLHHIEIRVINRSGVVIH